MLKIPPTSFENYDFNDYGAIAVIEDYLAANGRDIASQIYGQFQHGWIGRYRNIHPELVVGGNGLSRMKKHSSRFFVAREDQVSYLRSEGYDFVYAVGHPLVYLPKIVYSKEPASLLVMPMHSLADTSEDWAREGGNYLDYILEIRGHFSDVVVCVHPSCIEKGFWVNDFKRAGFRVIEGANGRDKNALLRMQAIFSQFDYVTSNGHGSPVAYASYFGAKVSVCGPKPKWDRSARTDIFFKNAPELLDHFELWRSTDFLDKAYPQFNLEPHLATQNRAWACYELGEQCKKTAAQLLRIVEPSARNILVNKIVRLKGALRR